jgi:hypothetical protein
MILFFTTELTEHTELFQDQDAVKIEKQFVVFLVFTTG